MASRARPHLDAIRSGEDAQVYEAIMADVDGLPTFTLLRAAS